jgi:hypothetical protein
MKWVQPSHSYEILLPESIVHQADDLTSSFWISGEPVLLQLSSYVKIDGNPIPAGQRLQERIAKSSAHWKMLDSVPLPADVTEQAAAETIDSDGLLWIHAYVVWPHLTVYVTVSGPQEELRNPKNWAITALETMRLTPP